MRGVEMKAINWKNALYIIAGIIVVILIVKLMLNDMIISFDLIIDVISLSVAIISAISILFCKTLWKFKIFQKWLVLVPNLNGKWDGTIDSTATDPWTYEDCKNIKAELTIKQTLFSISCNMKTDTMSSESLSADFVIDTKNQKQQLIYTYQSIPKQTVQHWSPIHFGTVIYNLDSLYNTNILEGNYWTGRETSGYIKLQKLKNDNKKQPK